VVPLSVLDLAFITEGSTPVDALRNSLDLAHHVERVGYRRFWLAEHHNMIGIASATTAVVIGYVASETTTIRVGAGGIMLPNHSPLVIAEQFGTLATLYPLLTWGSAAARHRPVHTAGAPPHADERRDLPPRRPGAAGAARAATAGPDCAGTNTNVPLSILGSSLFGAQLAAVLGLPYAFASHFAPEALMPALAVYREKFQPSAQLDRPLRHDWRERDQRRHGRRSSAHLHVRPAELY
jgi:alkanesulfonate monooxygenase SsuD/methylene tetrahydromethanopterin reductase-like flavin-dependent oxidoreductase (luciferase family)